MVNALTPASPPLPGACRPAHPARALGDLHGLRLAYVGDGNNVARSLAIACELAGVELTVAAPDGYQLEEGHGVKLTEDPRLAVSGADAIYTDVWVSMGDEEEAERRRADLTPFRVDADLLGAAKDSAVVLHCLPAHPGEEIAADVLYGPRSAVWDQAENRLHTQKALLRTLLAKLSAMYPEINLGPLTLQTFGLMFALAFLAAGALIWKRLGEIGKPVDWAYEIGFSALVGGVVGSRLYFLVENWDSVKDDLLGNVFSGSGLVWYGGAIGGALAVLLWAWYRDFLAPRPARPGRRLRWRSATRSGESAASSPAMATTAGPGTDPGRCPTPTAPCRPAKRSTRRRSTRRWRWALAPGCSGSCATASAPACCSRSTSSTPAPSASWSSSSGATAMPLSA